MQPQGPVLSNLNVEHLLPQTPEYASVALRALANALGQREFDRSAAAFLSELATGLGCARVSVGLVERGVVHIKAMSHSANIPNRGELLRDIGDAMEEAIDQGRALRVPPISQMPNPGGIPAITRVNQRLRTYLGGVVQTVPIRVHEAWVGAICCEWDGAGAADPVSPEALRHVVDLTGPVLHLMYRDALPARMRLREALARTGENLRGERGRWPRRVLLALVLALLGATLIPVQQSVNARAHLEGSVERVVAAPMDGFIDKVHVRPGDRVSSGQTVLDLSAVDLELEARRWETERAQHENAYMAALARSQRGDMVVSLSRAEEARARLELVERKLARMSLAAGIDGVVIDGDVGRLEGAPVARGDVLLTIAPADGHRVILEVDERDIRDLQTGQQGSVLLGAIPDQALPIEVTRITPMAQIVDGSNTYRIEARLLEAAPSLRPGLRGVARVYTGRAPMLASAWQWVSDRARLAWWRWGG